MRNGYLSADHVLFQSEFCRTSAKRFLGRRAGPCEVLYNAVDTARFTPRGRRSGSRNGPTVLLAGTQYQRYRFEAAVRTLARLPASTRLVVTGRLSWTRSLDARDEALRLIRELDLEERVELVGPYRQSEAPDIFRRADLLLHPKYNDPCPGVVLEAMACGLPVVYSASGGTPELVGADAGIGVPAPLDWEVDHPPDPELLARAVLGVCERLDECAKAARVRAERFDVGPWLERHRELFESLVG